jgi:hypothetical protein
LAAIGTVTYKLEVEDDTSARSVTWAGRPGRLVWARRMRPSWAVSFFYSDSFLIFCIMICFITLSFELQMHSNKILKFCKIQHINMTQQETSFDDKT